MSKTYRIARLVEKANHCFRESPPASREIRKAIQTFVTDCLMDAHEYHGFRYLTAAELPAGVPPGVIHADGGNTFPDDSRIAFYCRN